MFGADGYAVDVDGWGLSALDHVPDATRSAGHPPNPARRVLCRAGVSVSVVSSRAVPPPHAVPLPGRSASTRISILEDDATLGELAAELCHGLGAEPEIYDAPADLLEAARLNAPRALVLDWRLQGQLGAAAFMAVRHRYPAMPVVCWTASPAWNLPQMIRDDPTTQVIDKAAGATAFEAAVRWAIG
jgi:CheY-like chemotaxis protein